MAKKINRGMSRARKAIVAILSILLIIDLLFLGVRVGERAIYAEFYKNAEKAFAYPGLNDGFVGQGLDLVSSEEAGTDKDVYLTCGYSSKKGEASMVYLIEADGTQTKTELKKSDGGNYTGHTGGIAHYKEYVYITGSDGCDVFNLSDFLQKKPEARQVGEVKTLLDPAYCTIHNGKLYTGSFYRNDKNYGKTDWITDTPAGEKNTAAITVFNLNDTPGATFYVDPAPTEFYSTRSLVQGMTFVGNEMVLSCSYGFASSYLYFYDVSALASDTIEIGGHTVPRHYLESTHLTKTVKAPPMSEEIVYDQENGKLTVMCESASNKYIFGKFMSATYIYGYKV